MQIVRRDVELANEWAEARAADDGGVASENVDCGECGARAEESEDVAGVYECPDCGPLEPTQSSRARGEGVNGFLITFDSTSAPTISVAKALRTALPMHLHKAVAAAKVGLLEAEDESEATIAAQALRDAGVDVTVAPLPNALSARPPWTEEDERQRQSQIAGWRGEDWVAAGVSVAAFWTVVVFVTGRVGGWW